MGTKKITKIILIILTVIIFSASLYVVLNPITARDFFNQLFYKEPQEITAIRENLELTDRASFIFKSSRPVLEPHDDFLKSCGAVESSTYTLGCYSNGVIHVYKLDSSTFPGLIESTSAHELLHAIWERLSDTEKATLTPELEKVYNSNQSHFAILSVYSDENRMSELYARVGSEISSLPDPLEQHFQEYFKDQDKVVSYYTSYSAPIKKLETELGEKKQKIDALKTEILEKTNDYQSRLAALNTAITDFNNCANTVDCFSADDFRARRLELSTQKSELDALNFEIKQKTVEYNELVDSYNETLKSRRAIDELIEKGNL